MKSKFIDRVEAWTAPPRVSAYWLDRQLVPFLVSAQRRLATRVVAVTIACVATAVVSASALATKLASIGIDSVLITVASAGAAALATAAALYPLLRKQHSFRLRSASVLAHNNIEWLMLLGKLTDLRDPETSGHNLRATVYTVMFAKALNMSPEGIVRVAKGALLHDIGKLVVPDSILSKPRRLDPVERREMETHVEHGLDLVAQAGALNDAIYVVGAHHERFDGKGYPFGLQGEEIPFEARVFALIDVFDALTSSRVYKPAMTVAEALAQMTEERGSHFDPVLFDRFIDLVPSLDSGVPKDETSLVSFLQQQLLPYIHQFTHMASALAETCSSDTSWRLQMNTYNSAYRSEMSDELRH